MTISVDIPGSKVIEVDGELALAFGSYNFTQEDIVKISKYDSIVGILFYQAEFRDVDLSILKELPLKKLTVLHGNFSDIELYQIEGFESLESLKLLDTKASEEAISLFVSSHPNVELK